MMVERLKDEKENQSLTCYRKTWNSCTLTFFFCFVITLDNENSLLFYNLKLEGGKIMKWGSNNHKILKSWHHGIRKFQGIIILLLKVHSWRLQLFLDSSKDLWLMITGSSSMEMYMKWSRNEQTLTLQWLFHYLLIYIYYKWAVDRLERFFVFFL